MLDASNNSLERIHQMHTTAYGKITPPPISEEMRKQEPFSLVAPILKTALLMGAGGGFMLATVLTVTYAFSVPLGAWWEAVAQAHGHLQLYGWAGLFVLGVALHFLPRLRGTPLAGVRLVPWLLGILIVSLVLRAFSQPLLATDLGSMWSIGLVSSGILEMGAFVTVLLLLILTTLRGPRPTTRPAYWSVFPFIAGAFCSLAIASIIFPRRVLWPLAGVYFAGLILLCVGVDGGQLPTLLASIINGIGMILLGGVVLLFVGIFLSLIGRRGYLPGRVAKLAPSPETLAQNYQKQVKKEQTNYGPFVGLVASAYLWAMLGALLLLIDGGSLLATGSELVAFDAVRHSFAIGFIALLICGIAPRMLPGFSGGKIVSPKLVSATLWLGNAAVVLRVGSILFAPLFASTQGFVIDTFLFSLSGPFGLALAICLAINLWPTLRSSPRHVL
jgi:uncharacterized protein involved in response to NO